MPRTNVKGLYLLTEDGADDVRLGAVVRQALGAGLKWLQYRDKSRDAARRLRQAGLLAQWCRDADAHLLINDDVALAKMVNAAGVHLGQHDGDLAAARAMLGPNAVIGASCYNDLELARSAIEAGASYLAFGAMYASGTKPLARSCPHEVLTAARGFGLPIVAIGGITPDNAGSVYTAGADAIAVLGCVWQADDAVSVIKRFSAMEPK
ncbi:MAG: thiamine phosphate synthase [Ahniella sp.]|nr:thiamine phosphate synthase [Ahniella sp.]